MEKLVLVYNARSGFFNKLNDFAHKALSPMTYSCSLCKITYGDFKIKAKWKSFLENLPMEKEFLYIDQLEELSPELKDLSPPFILKQEQEGFEILLSAKELDQINALQELIALLSEKLGVKL